MLYLDTSLLIATLTNEVETERMQHWLGRQPEDNLAISDWVATEFSSALSIKLRTGQIRIVDRAEALSAFTRLVTDSFTAIPVSKLDFRTAARFADQHAIGLRAGDALHLAICANHGATLCTLDRRLGDTGSALGVEAMLL
jgi:predicted nucleic acid-binding protein